METQGNPAQAAKIYVQLLAKNPNNKDAQNGLRRLNSSKSNPALLIQTLYQQGKFQQVVRAISALPTPQQNAPGVVTLLGASQMQLGNFKGAEDAFRKSLMLAPDKPASHNNLGLALRAQGRMTDAERAFRKALNLAPTYAEGWNSLGAVLQESGQISEALAAFTRATELNADNPEFLTNLGNMFQKTGDLTEAVNLYHRALKAHPRFAGAHFNLGLALKATGQLEASAEHYEKAISASPKFAAAYINLGNVLQSLGRLAQAETILKKAVDLAPKDANAQNSYGTLLQRLGRLDEAVAAYDAALRADDNHAMASAQRLHQMAHMCDFRAYADFADVTDTLGIDGDAVPPLTLLAMEDHAERQLARASNYAQTSFPDIAPLPQPPQSSQRPAKLRIGYFSADYRSHPVARLIAGTLKAHDRNRFELIGYSFGPNQKDALRDELSQEFSTFRDIRAISDSEAAQLVKGDKLDIAIDLTSYTQHSRTALFAKRLAPVQMNYLGYPGTSGAPFMDYIVVDPTLVPSTHRNHVSEALLSLPHCYQPNDNRRDVPKDSKTRAEHGLPEDALVLCCFNSTYKITPREFVIWMRVLEQVPNAVLWLLESNDWAQANLKAQAVKVGIASDRLVFAPRASNREHLARHQHADLFLDTFAYNAHTTGSDALWMGVPIVTLLGDQFAARVCGSLLKAVGLPELITDSEADYEALILALAQDPDRRAQLKTHLEGTRATAPLFDTEGYTRDLETGFDMAHELWRAGQAPQDIQVPTSGQPST